MPRYDYVSMGFYTYDCLGWPFTEVPPGGGAVFIDELTLAVSGAGGTAAIAAAKMGLNTLALGGVGEDLMGDWVLERLKHFGVDTWGMQHKPGWKTSSSIVTTRMDGSRPALHMKGATKDFVVTDDMFSRATDCTVFHAGGIGLTEAMDNGGHSAKIMKAAKAAGAKTTVDVFAGSPKDLPAVAAVLPYTDYFMPSIEEAQALCGLSDLGDTAKFFLDKGVHACVLTLGGDGAYYHDKDGLIFTIPAYDIRIKCSCGCGDAFDSGFAVGLVKGFSPEDCVRFAQATAALNGTGLGSQAGVVDYESTLKFMKTTKVKG
jgi:sugar/nucleoside kinase (ribokinase family)